MNVTPESSTMSQEPFLRKLTLRNFRSIRNEAVTFANPLFLVGRNGSGKSNLVSALAFLSECMTTPLQLVVEQWGGVGRIGHLHTPLASPHVNFHLDFQIGVDSRQGGVYAFALRVTEEGDFFVSYEHCSLTDDGVNPIWFNRTETDFRTNISGIKPALSPRSLVMPVIGGVQELSAVYEALSSMRLYQIRPELVGGIQEQSGSPYLKPDGSNSNSVLLRLSKRDNGFVKRTPGSMSRVRDLLQSVVPGISPGVPEFVRGQSALFVEQNWSDSKVVLEAEAMSSGTLSALGLIVAALQEPAPSLTAIEEPELNIYPGALDAIGDIINVAAQRTQVVVTTHSPDLIDAKWIRADNLRVVEWANGETRISELGLAPVKALRQHLLGAGELMRANALDAAPLSATEDVSDLFEKDLA